MAVEVTIPATQIVAFIGSIPAPLLIGVFFLILGGILLFIGLRIVGGQNMVTMWGMAFFFVGAFFLLTFLFQHVGATVYDAMPPLPESPISVKVV